MADGTTADRLFAELPPGTLVRRVLVWQTLGLLLLMFHVLLVRQSIWLFPIMPLLLGWLYFNAPLTGILVFFQVLIYQNLMISLFSPGMDYMPTFVALSGTNFVALGIVALIALGRLTVPYWWRQFHGVIWMVLITLAVTAAYTLLGAAKAGPTSAMVYFREFAAPMFAVLVGLDLGRIWGFKTIATAFIFSVVLSIGLGLIEYSIPLDYYAWVHEVPFYRLKYTMQPTGNSFFSPADIVDHFTDAFMDISGTSQDATMTTFRFGGSIITPTSFAYVLAVVGLVAVALRRSLWLLVIGPLLFLVGAKGALILLLLSLTLWVVWWVTRNKFMLVLSGTLLTIAYVAFGIILGLQSNDYHVAGFLGGLHSLLADPLGHGIGVGGNMSSEANALNGHGGFKILDQSFALESAIGVLFYQTGAASLVIFAMFIVVVMIAPLGELRNGRFRPARQDILVIAMAMIIVNGVFQEEAYSPYAAGTIALLCACIVGNGRRQYEILYSRPSTFHFSRVSA